MIKNAFVEQDNEGKVIVRVKGKNICIFDNYDTALEWAFSIGYHVYKKVPHSHSNGECWVKYIGHR